MEPDEVTAHHRGALHALLSRLFLKELDAPLLRELTRPAIADVLEVLEPGFSAYVAAAVWDAERFEEEAAEYARLFLLPRGVSPYAAAWMQGDEGAIRADLEERITNLYEVLRVRPTDFGLGNVPSDHVGMLLALTAAAEATDASGDLTACCLALLAPWAPGFAARVADESHSPLYRAAGRLLGELL